MTDIERRLHHAARRLREVSIEPPPFETLGAAPRRRNPMFRVPALLMPVLFVLGGLAAVAGTHSRTVESDIPALAAPAGVAPVAAPATAVVAGAAVGAVDGAVAATAVAASAPEAAPPMSVQQEIALISSLGSKRSSAIVDASAARAAPMRRYL